MKDEDTLLSICGISFAYGKKPVIENLDFSVIPGECVGIIGKNGCGKTTLLKLIGGLLYPQKGYIDFSGSKDGGIPPVAGFLEAPKLTEYLSGDENLRYCLEKQYSPQKAKEAFELWELSEYADKPVSKYSLGMKQKLGLIIAFLSGAPLMVFDEPTNALDFNSVKTFYSCVSDAVKAGRSVLLVTHLLYDLKQNCSRILEIEGGHLKEYREEYNCHSYTIEFPDAVKAGLAAKALEGSEVVSVSGNSVTVNEAERSVSEIIRVISAYDIVTVSRCSDTAPNEMRK